MNDDYSDEGWSPFWCGHCLVQPTAFGPILRGHLFSHVSQLHIPDFTKKVQP